MPGSITSRRSTRSPGSRGFAAGLFRDGRRAVPGISALKSPRLIQRVRRFRSTSATATVPHFVAWAMGSPVWSKIAEIIQFRDTSS